MGETRNKREADSRLGRCSLMALRLTQSRGERILLRISGIECLNRTVQGKAPEKKAALQKVAHAQAHEQSARFWSSAGFSAVFALAFALRFGSVNSIHQRPLASICLSENLSSSRPDSRTKCHFFYRLMGVGRPDLTRHSTHFPVPPRDEWHSAIQLKRSSGWSRKSPVFRFTSNRDSTLPPNLFSNVTMSRGAMPVLLSPPLLCGPGAGSV